jgi:hypothetical protein
MTEKYFLYIARPLIQSIMHECFPIDDFDITDWTKAETAFAGRKAMEFGQSWRAERAADFAPGEVRLGWRPDALWVFATLHDTDIFSNSPATASHVESGRCI